MKRKQINEKLNSIEQINYAVLDINDYNTIIYENIIRLRKINDIRCIVDKNIDDSRKIEKINEILNSY